MVKCKNMFLYYEAWSEPTCEALYEFSDPFLFSRWGRGVLLL